MRLGLVMLINSSTLNNLMYQNQAQVNPGENFTVMFQLIDLDQMQATNLAPNAIANRYIPSSGATMMAALTSFNVANSLSKIPINPFPDDRSVWAFNLNSAETAIMAGINLTVTLIDGSNVKIATGQAVIIVGPRSQYSC
jgi:hypothetical protein